MTENVDLFLDSDVFACDEVRNGFDVSGMVSCLRGVLFYAYLVEYSVR